MSVKLSILIPSTNDRFDMTEALVDGLYRQLTPENSHEVEVITHYDNRELSIGAKRQMMIENCNGEYVCFIDSDDRVPEDYVSTILRSMETKPDCICFNVECTGTKGKIANISNKWRAWGRGRGKYDYVRTPNHLVPIKREIALAIGYRDIRYAEDHDYSMRLKKSRLIKKEVFLDKIMYYYIYKDENLAIKFGMATQ